jgi:hypothetical protein
MDTHLIYMGEYPLQQQCRRALFYYDVSTVAATGLPGAASPTDVRHALHKLSIGLNTVLFPGSLALEPCSCFRSECIYCVQIADR